MSYAWPMFGSAQSYTETFVRRPSTRRYLPYRTEDIIVSHRQRLGGLLDQVEQTAAHRRPGVVNPPLSDFMPLFFRTYLPRF